MKHNYFFKKIIPYVIVFCTLQGFAQIPVGYYNAASGLTGDQLKSSLHTIIDGHIEFPYSSTTTDVWDILKEADRDPNNPNNVIGIYSGFSMNAALEYDGGLGWNREHVWAKSRGDFGTTLGAGTDTHHLRAADVSTNSARNNRNFGNCTVPYTDGSGNYSGPTASFTSSTEWVWQPPASVKGDVARMIFYMTTRYEGTNGEPDLELTEVLLTNTDKTPFHAKMSTLLQWHLEDPVDNAERTRNDIIYSFQQNRNPFIDHPEYVCQIWACGSGNLAPGFTSVPVTTATEGQVYAYNVTASDANADPLTMAATTLPTWLSFVDNSNGTATLSGTPGAAQVGAHAVVLEVSDGIAAATSQSFSVTVSGIGANAPMFTSTPVTTGTENQLYSYTITATDADADLLTISAPTKPAWLSFVDNGNGTATLSGTPAAAQVGLHAIVLEVSDGIVIPATAQSFSITVNAAGSGVATELFVSEYIEGSSYNKGLEIANFTGTSVNLSGYSLFKQTNGAGAWGSELALTGTIANGDVYVIVHTSANAAMQAVADLSTGAGPMTFNGNDAIALFKNGTLIDVIGNFNSAANYAIDQTMVRKSSVSSPNTTYTTTEWTVFATDTSTDLGTHTFDGAAPATCNVPAGLLSASITETSATISWTSATGAAGYNVRYRVSGSATWTNTTSASLSLNLSGLSSSTIYEFQVSSQCGATASAYSASATFTTLTPTATCNVPTGLVASGITETGANLSWTSTGAAAYGVRYRVTGTTTWVNVNSAVASLSLSALTAATSYESQVRSQCGATNSGYTASTTFSTLSPASVTYCLSTGNNATEEWINRFVFNTIDNTSGMNSGYANFTAISTTVNAGTIYPVTIYPAWSGNTFNEAYNIWIDFNHDGDFIDAGEAVYSISKNKLTSISGSITIPTTALSGTTRMRVTLKYNANANSCETFSYGEVEDYTIDIAGAPLARKGTVTVVDAQKVVVNNIERTIYPNPTSDILNVMVEARDGAHLQILTMSGKVMMDRHYAETGEVRIDVSKFDKGIYILSIENGGGKVINRVVVY
jgi:endonuclease I